MGNDVLYKYLVIKLEKPPNKCLDKYLCVPRSWTSKAHEDANWRGEADFGRVQAWYPFGTSLVSELVRSRVAPDLNQGGMHTARVKYKTDFYNDATSWILLKESEIKIKRNNRHKSPVNEKREEDNQSSNAKELPTVSDNSSNIQDTHAEVHDEIDLTIVEDGKDEPVTSSSSTNNKINIPDGKPLGDIACCILVCMQSLLKDVQKDKKEQFRIEFDELRVVRVCDNNLLDRLSKLSIDSDHMYDGTTTTGKLAPATQDQSPEESEAVTEITITPVAQEAPSSTVPPNASVSQPSQIDLNISSAQITANHTEHVSPSTERSATVQSSPRIQVCTEALRQIALNAKYLTDNSTAPDTSTSKNVGSAHQNSSEPIVIDYPLTMQATDLSSHHPAPQVPVSPAAISSTTNDSPRTHHAYPTVTVCSPEEINGRFTSQNTSIPVRFDSYINERMSPENSSNQLGIYPSNNTVRPAIKSLVTRRRYSHYTSALVTAIAAKNNRSNPRNSQYVVNNSVSPDLTTSHRHINSPIGFDQMPLAHNSMRQTVTFADLYARMDVQTSVSPVATATDNDNFVRSLVQDPYNRPHYRSYDQDPLRDTSRPREETGFWNPMNSSMTREPFTQREHVAQSEFIPRRRQSTLPEEENDSVILLD